MHYAQPTEPTAVAGDEWVDTSTPYPFAVRRRDDDNGWAFAGWVAYDDLGRLRMVADFLPNNLTFKLFEPNGDETAIEVHEREVQLHVPGLNLSIVAAGLYLFDGENTYRVLTEADLPSAALAPLPPLSKRATFAQLIARVNELAKR